jgi:glycerate 2-kinase
MNQDPETLLRAMLDAAIDAARPATCIPPLLPPRPRGRTIVLGAGKASAAMARTIEEAWPGPLEGLVVTRYGHAVPCERIEIVEAAHPVPDQAGVDAAGRILALAESAGPDDLVLFLVSGGGSALLTLPADGISLADKQAVNKALLASGADIGQMNVLRKHLSRIKGGRLAAAAHPATLLTLAISDVPGDDLATIASGPTVPDPSTCADALDVLRRFAIDVPAHIRAHLETCADESPKPGDPRLATCDNIIVARPQDSLQAAAEVAREAGVTPIILGDAIEGEAREVAKVMAGIAGQVRRFAQPHPAPAVLISGGETTVTLRGEGRGGRNSEFLLALAIQLAEQDGVFALAADSDGIDGIEDNAGAIVRPDTLARARQAGLDPKALLADNDSYRMFEALGDLVVTGPTLTNVNDLRFVLVVAGEGG